MEKLIDRFFAFVTANPTLADDEIAEALDCSVKTVEGYRFRLRDKGCLDWSTENKVRTIRIIKPYREPATPTSEQEICYHMVNKFLTDFDEAETFEKRVIVGKEIRMLLELARGYRRK